MSHDNNAPINSPPPRRGDNPYRDAFNHMYPSSKRHCKKNVHTLLNQEVHLHCNETLPPLPPPSILTNSEKTRSFDKENLLIRDTN